MDKFLDTYSKWDPQQQLIFACVTLVLGLLGFVIAGLMASSFITELGRLCVSAVRGWPPIAPPDDEPVPLPDVPLDPHLETASCTPSSLPLSANGPSSPTSANGSSLSSAKELSSKKR